MKKNLQSIFLLLAALFLPLVAHAADGLPGLGDVNSDGSVDVNDVTDLIGYVLGDASDAFNADNADTNADGYIDIEDVTSRIETWDCVSPFNSKTITPSMTCALVCMTRTRAQVIEGCPK